jgi:hypothetical protein
MATVTFAQLRTRLDTRLKDATDTSFTSSEKDEFMTTAFNDPYVARIKRDSSLTMPTTAVTYATAPAGYDYPAEIQVDANLDGVGWDIGKENWDAIDGRIYFTYDVRDAYSGNTLYLVGKVKYTTSDSIQDYMAEYVLELATVEAYEFMKSRLATRFLTNDMTMSDLINGIQTHKNRARELKTMMPVARSVEW